MSTACVLFGNSYFNANNPIAKGRTLSSLPYGGRYRNIDFVLSSLVEANISNIVIPVVSEYSSIIDHIGSGKDWDLARKKGGIKIFPPYSKANSNNIRNKIDSLRDIKQYLMNIREEYIILSDCNFIMNFDFNSMVKKHIENEAYITVYYTKAKATYNENISLDVSESGRITSASIVATSEKEINKLIPTFIIGRNDLLLQIDTAIAKRWDNLEFDFILRNIDDKRIFGFLHEGYCASIYTMLDFYNSNMDILKKDVRASLFSGDTTIYTKVKDSVPAKYGNENKVVNSLIADGCEIDGEVINSVIFRGAKIKKGAVVKNSIVMQNGYIGEGSIINCVICDKNVVISDNSKLSGIKKSPHYIEKNAKI